MWTYNAENLSTADEDSRKNIVRLLIGDTDSNDPQLQDEEILFALSSNKDNPNVAAIFAINAIISKYARLVNIELDEAIREDYSDLIDNYKGLLSGLEKKVRLSNNSIRIYATGLTLTDFEEAWSDPNRIKPGIEQGRWGTDYADPYDRNINIT